MPSWPRSRGPAWPFAGYAVVSAIIAQPDIEQASRDLLAIINE